MRPVPILPVIKKSQVPVQSRNFALPAYIESVDGDSFKQVINTILNSEGNGYSLSDLALSLQDLQLVVYGNVSNDRETYCKFACYFDYYDEQKRELTVSFSIVIGGTAVLATHVEGTTLYFDGVVSQLVTRESRRV